ncbi:UNVERIFIED_ORG: hypothetical protein GCAPEGMB_00348 [Vibrio phage V07]|nr:hypothetical protein COHAPHLL_00267 [Vibrio phage V09]WOL25064.1 hypothetical protein [Vibrio phage PG216]
MYKSNKRTSISKMKRVAEMPDSEIIFTLSRYENIDGVTIKSSNTLNAVVVRGLFLYRTVSDYSQTSEQRRCERIEFDSDTALERYMNLHTRKRKRFTLDDVLYGTERCRFENEFDVQLSRKHIFS